MGSLRPVLEFYLFFVHETHATPWHDRDPFKGPLSNPSVQYCCDVEQKQDKYKRKKNNIVAILKRVFGHAWCREAPASLTAIPEMLEISEQIIKHIRYDKTLSENIIKT